MRSNSSGWLWLLLMFIGGLSSLFEKWSKHQKEERNRIKPYKNNTVTSSTHTIDGSDHSPVHQAEGWQADVEMSVTQSLRNQQKWRQQRQIVSENEETDFGDELDVDSFATEVDLPETPLSITNVTRGRKRHRLTARNIRQAILYQEILNRPKSLR